MSKFAALISRHGELISNRVFSEDAHQSELERVFARCWLFAGHDSLIPRNHDYFVSMMGIDSVIVQRDGSGKIRIYLNKCRHRGNQLCVYDAGNSPSFTCSYHGWNYQDGSLTGMPHAREAYRGEIDLGRWGLVEVSRVAVLGGLIFACWDAEAMPLEEYLGDAKWYLECFLLREEMGGLEVLPGAQKYIMPTNWKLLAENFAGDDYHFETTHESLIRVLSKSRDQRISYAPQQPAKAKEISAEFSVAANHGRGPAHGIMGLKVGPAYLEHDRRQAEAMGGDVLEWVNERSRRLEERLKRYTSRPYSFHTGNIFPNFALIGAGTAFYGKGLILHHPSAWDRTEVWMWCAVEKDAPVSVKKLQQFVLMQRQSAAGMVAPDDHEIFQRIGHALRSPLARRQDFHYGMALGHDAEDPRPREQREGAAWPGRVIPSMSEVIQRDFYRYWAELMDAP